ncbi:hypothetical protein N0V83_005347 [Neocucurbitaria cava]|uniref:Peptidase M6-like domain-containing protein n=1 Tax=Neocucurbitaria cava TaxID=798079 RepID=A0A9W8Y6W8_9PLEO|nr:hypothetical protein N0V83_005347 [Neocucurbitaria cava]
MAASTKERMQDLWFSANRRVPTGSVTEYFSEVSNGAISLRGEVVGPFTLPNQKSHYANNQCGRGWPEPNSQTMANDAFDAAFGNVDFDFKMFDNDGNGYVDAFVVVHAGRDAAETGQANDIWSVKWTLPAEREADGAKVYGFLTVAEDAKCGVCAHEIGHLVFGWPDLYDTDYESSGTGNWCLMSFGCWGSGGDRPVHPSAWCKANQGWVETITEMENHEITLEDVKAGRKVHRLWTNGDASSQEYFLIENRQLIGFDQYLPAGGLLIWHIDDSAWSNTDESHPKVKLIQADGLELLKGNWGRGDVGDVFPGFVQNCTFNSASNPNSRAYSGEDTLVSVTDIPAPSPSMTFNITVKRDNRPARSTFDSKMWYRLKNTYHPDTHCLDVINDNSYDSTGLLKMARDGRYSGQHWQIKSNGDGTYFLRTLFLGPNRQLDTLAHDKTTPILQPTAFVMNQFWQITPWGDGTWCLTNAYSGQYQCMDTMEGSGKMRISAVDAARMTQRWTIIPMREITEEGF